MKLKSACQLIVSLSLLPALASCQEKTVATGKVTADSTGGGTPVLVKGEDWPTWGRDSTRNMVGNAKNLPVEVNPGEMDDETEVIDMKTTKNVRWIAKLGSQSYGNVSVANGKVFAGTNNESPRDKRNVVDRGNLMCFDEKTGEFQNFLQVYDKESQPCPRCEVPLQRIVQQQRSTFFCIGCQK